MPAWQAPKHCKFIVFPHMSPDVMPLSVDDTFVSSSCHRFVILARDLENSGKRNTLERSHADMASVAALWGQRGRPKSGPHADPCQRGKRQNTANSLCFRLCRLNVLIALTTRNGIAFVSRSRQLQAPVSKHCKFIAFLALSR